MNAKTAKELIEKYQNGTATSDEVSLIERWVLYGKVKELDLSDEELAADFSFIRSRLPLAGETKEFLLPTQRRPAIWPTRLWAAMAAAAVFAVLGIWLFYGSPLHLLSKFSKSDAQASIKSGDIAPGKNSATIAFADGSTISLSESKHGIVIDQSKLAYNDHTDITSSFGEKHLTGNLTVSTPRGGLYQVVLSDGSKVWLNAASSIKFPSSFEGAAQRTVELVGEAYFEVFRNPKQQFVVVSRAHDGLPGQKIEVLGTHFNINSYSEEGSIITTLLSGSLQVTVADRKSILLEPGEETVLDENRIDKRLANTELAIAWRKGTFYFNKTPFDNLMRQLARWYNVDIVYQTKKIPDIRFSGEMKRDVTLQTLLTYLEDLGVDLQVEGRTLVIK